MIRPAVTLEETLRFLNDLVALDPALITALVEERQPCTPVLVHHPTLQVLAWDGKTQVGVLGLLNGLFGADDWHTGPLASVYQDGRLIGFTYSDAEGIV